MAWPPTDHGDVQDVVTSLRSAVAALRVQPGPATILKVFPDNAFPVNTITAWSGSLAGGTDAAGAYRNMTVAGGAVTSARFAVDLSSTYWVKLKVGGDLPNRIQVNFYNASGTFVSNTIVYVYASSNVTYPVTAAGVAVTQAFRVDVPATTGITQADLIITPRSTAAGDATNQGTTRIYAWRTGKASDLPFQPRYNLGIPYRGIGLQKLRDDFGWHTSGMTEAQMTSHLQFLVDTFGLRRGDGIRMFMSLDTALNKDGAGVPTSWKPAVWTGIATWMTVVRNFGLKYIPSLYYPTPWTGGEVGITWDRTAMTNTSKAAGYYDVTVEMAAYLDTFEDIVAIDPINEYSWALGFTGAYSAPYYTYQQRAAAYDNIASAVRAGSSKLITASQAAGYEAQATLHFQDPALHDVIDYHSYNAPVAFYTPQFDKPIMAGEFGPAESTSASQAVADQAIPVMNALPSYVSAAYFWTNFAVVHPAPGNSYTGSITSQPMIDAFKAHTPAVDQRNRYWT